MQRETAELYGLIVDKEHLLLGVYVIVNAFTVDEDITGLGSVYTGQKSEYSRFSGAV